MVTQEDVAQRAGVSRSVVSYVLNGGPRKVSEETRQRVLEAIKDLGYRPNEHAQRLKQGNDVAQNSIGIITGGSGFNVLERPYYNIILSSLYDYAYQQDQQISFLVYWDALKDPIFFNKHIHEQEISSLILMLPSFILRNEEDEALLKEIIERIPNIVCLEESLLDLPAVIFDRADAARLAVNHLIKLGHREIAFVAIDDQRVDGYQQALIMNGLEVDDSLVDFLKPTLTPMESAYDIVTRLLDEEASFSAIFAANDEAAFGAMAALKDRGLHIPEDIAVVSIDNIDMASVIRPALTTVEVPKQNLARLALQLLVTLKNFPDQRDVSMMAPIELIVRESCGAKLPTNNR